MGGEGYLLGCLQVMQTYAEVTADYDGIEIVEGKVQGRCWDRGLPLRDSVRFLNSAVGSWKHLEYPNTWHIFLAMYMSKRQIQVLRAFRS